MFKTYGDALSFVENKLDLQDEIFITSAELTQYFEEAIKYCEAEIHKLDIEDMYFETVAPIALEAGVSTYALPENIYAQKILRLVFNDNTKFYDVRRNTRKNRYAEQKLVQQYSTGSYYSYQLFNNSVLVGPTIEISPASQDITAVVTGITATTTLGSKTLSVLSSTAGLASRYFVTGTGIPDGTWIESVDTVNSTLRMSQAATATGTTIAIAATEPRMLCYYIRRAFVPSVLTDYIDYPEFWNFITQHVIVECLKKELGNPRIADEKIKLDELRQQMIETLTDKVPDQEDEIEKDITAYDDMDNFYSGAGAY
jgi:hypothetical protein